MANKIEKRKMVEKVEKRTIKLSKNNQKAINYNDFAFKILKPFFFFDFLIILKTFFE